MKQMALGCAWKFSGVTFIKLILEGSIIIIKDFVCLKFTTITEMTVVDFVFLSNEYGK